MKNKVALGVHMLERRLITDERNKFVDFVVVHIKEDLQTRVSRGGLDQQKEVAYGLILGYARGEYDPAIESNPWRPTVPEEILRRGKDPDLVFTHNGAELAVLKEPFNLKGAIGVKNAMASLINIIVQVGKQVCGGVRRIRESETDYLTYQIDEDTGWLIIKVNYLD